MLLVWFKVLNFFRIFQSTGFLIRAILDVLASMGAFFTIYLIFLLAFGNSQLVIMVANPAESATYGQANIIWALYLSYLVSAGEFMLDDGFGDSAVWYRTFLFVVQSIILMIIMLNLFIAIISDVFSTVNSQGVRASYRENASLIAENQALVSLEEQELWVEPNKFLVNCEDLKNDQEEELSMEFKINEKMESMQEVLSQRIKLMGKNAFKENQELKTKFDQLKTLIEKKDKHDD